jgi:hypothetical protein
MGTWLSYGFPSDLRWRRRQELGAAVGGQRNDGGLVVRELQIPALQLPQKGQWVGARGGNC